MASILDHCTNALREEISAGEVLLREGETTGRLYVLAAGTLEVLRGETSVATVKEPGAVFGEMSVLLKRPHTATVKAVTPVSVYVFDGAESFLKSHPEIAFVLARMLAQRLNGATTYLVDLKRQFEDDTNHFGMVGEVLESLLHQQAEDLAPGSDLKNDPRL